ncbi:MAG: hypothetical protein E6G01_15945 [Actinobacteria bacterium]|nr:MAG: hypothetical protein E6G01_15945 [Actinomycetota bacterium]
MLAPCPEPWGSQRRRTMQGLRGFDAAFLHFETPTNHLHVGQTRVLDPSTAPAGHSFDAARLGTP